MLAVFLKELFNFLTLAWWKRSVLDSCLSYDIQLIWSCVVIICINLHRCRTINVWKWLARRLRWPINNTSRFHAGIVPKLASRRFDVVILSLERYLRRHKPLSLDDQATFWARTIFPWTLVLVSFQFLCYTVIPASRTTRSRLRAIRIFIGHSCSKQFVLLSWLLLQLRLKLLVFQFVLFQLITVKQLIDHLWYFYCKWVLLFPLQLIRSVIGGSRINDIFFQLWLGPFH